MIEINFTILILRLHQEGLTEILLLANNFQQKMESIAAATGKKTGDRIASAGPPLTTIEEEDEDAEEAAVVRSSIVKSASKKLIGVVDSIKVKLIAKMEQVAIELENARRPIANLKVRTTAYALDGIMRLLICIRFSICQIENLNAGVVMKTSYTEVSVKLQDIIVEDLNTQTIHSTVSILSSDDYLSVNSKC